MLALTVMCPCAIICLACLLVLAIPCVRIMDCNLLASNCFTEISKISSNDAPSVKIPKLINLLISNSCSFTPWSEVSATSLFACFLIALSLEVNFQISFLFFSPYSFVRILSSSILSPSHGCDGPEYFFLGFLTIPILFLSLSYSYTSCFSEVSFCSLSSYWKTKHVTDSSVGFYFLHFTNVKFFC